MNTELKHKAGFVNIIGSPNVGKSTFMNAITGEKLSIITPKAQTTRHRIIGIVNGEDYQIVFSDTPGILKPHYKLQKTMLQQVDQAFDDADLILYITDVNETADKNQNYIEKVQKSGIPILLVINKIDLISHDQLIVLEETWKKIIPYVRIIKTSALHNLHIDEAFAAILEMLPYNPPYYPKDELTDRPMRFFVSEIIREKIFLNYQKEIPYATEVEIESYSEGEDMDRIKANIHVERDSQKGIIIGHKGQGLKMVGVQAREEIEKLTGKKVYLELVVKVSKNWRESDRYLKRFGYQI